MKKWLKNFIRRELGLTLMELAVTMVAVTIILIPVAELIQVSTRGYRDVATYNVLMEGTRIGMNILMSELRSIQTQTDVSEGSATSITINVPASPRDRKYSFDSDHQVILYQEIAYILGIGVPTENQVFITAVTDFQLTYYDRDGATLSGPDPSLWMIGIELTVGLDDKEYTLSDQVFPRQWL